MRNRLCYFLKRIVYVIMEDHIIIFRALLLSVYLSELCKIWTPFTILPRLVLHNHAALNHPSFFSQELRYLKTSSIELSEDATLQALVRGYRNRCFHCHRHPKILLRALHKTPLKRIHSLDK